MPLEQFGEIFNDSVCFVLQFLKTAGERIHLTPSSAI